MLNTDQVRAAEYEALSTILQSPDISEQQLRAHMESYLGDSDAWWGEATSIILLDSVHKALQHSHVNVGINEAFAADMKLYTDSIAFGANIENPWATPGDALNMRIYVIAVSHGGDANVDGNADGVWDINDVPGLVGVQQVQHEI